MEREKRKNARGLKKIDIRIRRKQIDSPPRRRKIAKSIPQNRPQCVDDAGERINASFTDLARF